jgi:hypothetical protein
MRPIAEGIETNASHIRGPLSRMPASIRRTQDRQCTLPTEPPWDPRSSFDRRRRNAGDGRTRRTSSDGSSVPKKKRQSQPPWSWAAGPGQSGASGRSPHGQQDVSRSGHHGRIGRVSNLSRIGKTRKSSGPMEFFRRHRCVTDANVAFVMRGRTVALSWFWPSFSALRRTTTRELDSGGRSMVVG